METQGKWDKFPYIGNASVINKLYLITEFLHDINAVYKIYGNTVLIDENTKDLMQNSELELIVRIKREFYALYVTINSKQTKITISPMASTEILVSISTNKSNLLEHDGYFDEMDKFHTILFKFYTAEDIKELIDLLKNTASYEISFSK